MSVLGGTVEIEDQTYTVKIGYALYSVKHDTLRMNAFVIDEDCNGMKLKLRGTAVDEDAEFSMEDGESIDLAFKGNDPSHNRLDNDWQLRLEGTLKAD